MEAERSPNIPGVLHFLLDQHEDSRGFFMETFRAMWLSGTTFVQGNLSSSRAGVLRGLHYHLRQDDLWLIPQGRALVAVVDLRKGSPSYLQHETLELAGPRSIYIPSGVAHGFFAVAPTLMSYMVTNYYDGSDELGVAWNDPQIAIEWPTDAPSLSARDQDNPKWSDVPQHLRPEMTNE